ncbi:DUF885 family protein, partial [Gemmatimonadota bacterium]
MEVESRVTSDVSSIGGWMDQFFRAYYARRPVNATFIGVHDWDHLLPDFSDNGAGDAVAEMEGLLRAAQGIEGTPVSPIERLDQRLAEGFLRIQVWEYPSRHFHLGNPSLYTGEAVFGIMSLFLTDFAPFEERVEAATERLEAVPGFLAQGRRNVRQAPVRWTQRAMRECRGALAFLEKGIDTLLAPPSEDGTSPRADDQVAATALRGAAQRAAKGFRDFHHYLESELQRAGSEAYACGEEALSLYLRDGHFLDMDADEIVAYAEAEMADAESRLREGAGQALGTPAGQRADVEEVLSGLADLHPPAERYYARYQDVWDSIRETAEAQSLLTWPDFPIRYVPRPVWAREAAAELYFLFYRSPPAFNRPPVHDYLVTPVDRSMSPEEQEKLLRATNDSVIKLNHVIHHGSIGHHVQNWHAFRSPSRIGQVAAVDCASRIAMFCGGTMAEGWACYATDLMSEAGALSPLEQLAELRGRTRMCARAVVD